VSECPTCGQELPPEANERPSPQNGAEREVLIDVYTGRILDPEVDGPIKRGGPIPLWSDLWGICPDWENMP
jgi:hypothetical protein